MSAAGGGSEASSRRDAMDDDDGWNVILHGIRNLEARAAQAQAHREQEEKITELEHRNAQLKDRNTQLEAAASQDQGRIKQLEAENVNLNMIMDDAEKEARKVLAMWGKSLDRLDGLGGAEGPQPK